jgi:hypothetical protein
MTTLLGKDGEPRALRCGLVVDRRGGDPRRKGCAGGSGDDGNDDARERRMDCGHAVPRDRAVPRDMVRRPRFGWGSRLNDRHGRDPGQFEGVTGPVRAQHACRQDQ